MLKNPYTTKTDTDAHNSLKALAEGRTTLQSLFTDPATGQITVGNITLDAADVGDTLNVPAEAPKSITGILAAQERLEKLAAQMGDRITKINAAHAKKARALLIKSPTTKNEVQFMELRDQVAGLNVFHNPLGESPAVNKTRDEKGAVYQVRIPGTAVTQVLPGETPDQAVNRLKMMIVDDSRALCVLTGMKPSDGNLRAIKHGVFQYRKPLPEGQVGVVSAYSLNFSDPARLLKCVKALGEVQRSIHLLDASRADSATLRLNLSADEALSELEAEIDGDPVIDVVDLADAI